MGWAARLPAPAKQAALVALTRRLTWHLPDAAILTLAERHPEQVDILAAVRPHLDGRPKDVTRG